MDAKFDWKTKWKEKTRGGKTIIHAAEEIDGTDWWYVDEDYQLERVFASGRYDRVEQSDHDLIPNKPGVVCWSSREQVDPSIKDYRPSPQDGWHAVERVEAEGLFIRPLSGGTAYIASYKRINDESRWRPGFSGEGFPCTTTTSEGV